MSKKALYRQSAAGNPIQLDKLPDATLETNFPVTTKLTSEFPKWTILAMLLGWLTFVTAQGLPMVVYGWAVATVIFLCAGLAFGNRYHKANRKILWRLSLWSFISAILLVAASFPIPDIPPATSEIAGQLLGTLAVFHTAFLLIDFQRHWMGRAVCNPLPNRVRQAFLERKELADGLSRRPFIPAAILGFHSFLNYDPIDSKVPGIYKSPAGPATRRIAITMSTILLWSCYLATPDGLSHLSKMGSDPRIIYCFAVPAIPLLLAVSTAVLFEGELRKGAALIEAQESGVYWSENNSESRRSGNSLAKRSIHLANVGNDGSPVLIPETQLAKGMSIQGPPGSGKTGLVMNILEQCIELGHSAVVLDLKSHTHELLAASQSAAQKVSLRTGSEVPVYTMTSAHGKASHLVDFFGQSYWKQASANDQTSAMLASFEMLNAKKPDERYFRDTNWMAFHHVLKKYPNITSFEDAENRLAYELKHAKGGIEIPEEVRKYGGHTRLILKRLSCLDAINFRESYEQNVLDSAVDFDELFLKQTVLHCALSAVKNPMASSEVGRILLVGILAAAANLQKRNRKLVLIIDEFQRVASRELDGLLQQCRSAGISVILTNQTSADLLAVDPHMPDTIAGNLAIQAWLKVTDRIGIEQVRGYGGQYIARMKSVSRTNTSEGNSSSTVTWSEQVLDRVSSGLIDRVNSNSNEFFLRINDNAGYAAYGGQLFVAQLIKHVPTEHEYRARIEMPWPSQKPGMLVNGAYDPPRDGSPADLLDAPQTPRDEVRTPNRLR